jgi:prephenate dehydrogenase
MTINVAVLGLGREGGSLASALHARPDMRLVGYDSNPDAAREAHKRGWLRQAHWNLRNAVDGADLVVLACPTAEQRDFLPVIAPELRAGAVVASLGPLLGPPLAWAAEALTAPDRYFVACHAALNPAYLHNAAPGLEAAAADLFRQGLWALAPAPGCAPEGLKLVVDLAHVLEAFPYHVDPAEHDGLAAAADGLPAVLAWALLQAAAASPGWPETRKLADRALATATAALDHADPAALTLNRDNVLRYLDAALAELSALRGRLAARDDPGVHAALIDAAQRRTEWLADRRRGDWEALPTTAAVLPGTADWLGRLLLGGLGRKRDSQPPKP